MALDHSLTYKELKLRHLPHMLRKRQILKYCREIWQENYKTYGDFGCSNGFLTNLVSETIKPSTSFGFEFNKSNLRLAQKRYSHIVFKPIDLNQDISFDSRIDFVTCFETIEHLGFPEKALENLISVLSPKGTLLLTVPIEIHAIGIIKFIVKWAYRYPMRELPLSSRSRLGYLGKLIKGQRIDSLRDQRKSWGTHFGFDYRRIDDWLAKHEELKVITRNHGTTRFYIINFS